MYRSMSNLPVVSTTISILPAYLYWQHILRQYPALLLIYDADLSESTI